MNQLIQSLLDAISQGAILGLAALAIGLVFGVIRLANFAMAEIITGAGYALVLTWQWGWYVAIPTAIVAAVLLSLLMEILVFSHLRKGGPATLLIASFGLSFLIQQVYSVVFGNDVRTAPVASNLAQTWDIGSLRVQSLSIVSIVLTAIMLAILLWFLRKTSLGLQLQAAAMDPPSGSSPSALRCPASWRRRWHSS